MEFYRAWAQSRAYPRRKLEGPQGRYLVTPLPRTYGDTKEGTLKFGREIAN